MDRPGPRARLGIVFALEIEQSGLARVLAQSHVFAHSGSQRNRWFVGNTELMTEVSGIGRRPAADATERLIDSGAQWIVCAGFAAALDPAIQAGDIIAPNRVLLHDSHKARPITCSERLVSATPPSATLGYAIRRYDLATTDYAVCRSNEKHDIRAATGAAAVDMESYGAAEACARMGVPFAAIRAISDTADQGIPKEVMTLASQVTTLNRMGFVLYRPRLWSPLLRLRRQARTASSNLGDVLATMLLRLL